jgi:hypothetical protein
MTGRIKRLSRLLAEWLTIATLMALERMVLDTTLHHQHTPMTQQTSMGLPDTADLDLDT